MLSNIRDHAARCAALHSVTTPAYAAAALNCARDDALSELRTAASLGLFRRLLLPGLGNTPCFQPTAKAGGLDARQAPKFLRAGISESSRWRGLLRGGVVFMHNPSLVWLTIEATLLLCEQYAIPSKGHTEPLIARDSSGGYEVYVLVPPEEAGKSPGAIIGNAAARWLPLLEKGATHLHLVTLAGCAAGALQSALSQFVPASHEDAVSELAQLDARIAADGTGAMRVQLAHRRAELAAASAVAPMPAFPWLSNKVVGVQV